MFQLALNPSMHAEGKYTKTSNVPSKLLILKKQTNKQRERMNDEKVRGEVCVCGEEEERNQTYVMKVLEVSED